MVTQGSRKMVAGLLLVSLVLSSVLLGEPHLRSPPLEMALRTSALEELHLQTKLLESAVMAARPEITGDGSDRLPPEDPYVTVTFRLEHCPCERTLRVLRNYTAAAEGSKYLAENGTGVGPDYWKTTCSTDAVRRGAGQRVAAYSFYGSATTARHKAKKYFAGIVENLALLPQLYPGWVMRLYYDLDPGDPSLAQLCELACGAGGAHLDLCEVRRLPGTPMRDAHRVFAMNWRFFPTLDPQVHTVYCIVGCSDFNNSFYRVVT